MAENNSNWVRTTPANSLDDLSPEEYLRWQAHPVTELYLKRLRELQAEKQADLGRGKYLCNLAEETLRYTAEAVGYCKGLQIAIAMQPERMNMRTVGVSRSKHS